MQLEVMRAKLMQLREDIAAKDTKLAELGKHVAKLSPLHPPQE